jgi:beta-lactamase regulating signal transducer with metallopeptidase domain
MSGQTILFDPELSGRLCLTLLHSLWQVAIAALIAVAAGHLWRKKGVEWRYLFHVAALVASLIAVPLTFSKLSAAPQSVPSSEAPLVSIHAPARLKPVADGPLPPAPLQQDEPERFDEQNAAAPQVGSAGPTPAANHLVLWQRFASWLAALYVAGVAAMLVRLVAGVVQAERIRRLARPLKDGPAAAALQGLIRQWNLRACPALAQAERIAVPMLVGLLKPTILLPASALTGLSPAELEMILAHELAHVRRFDMWVNLLQRLAEVVLFFNPALWYLSRHIAVLREYCCDEVACRRCCATSETSRLQYAATLMRMVELAQPPVAARHDLAALAASGRPPSELRRRVATLLGEPLKEPVRVSHGGLVAAATLALVIAAAPAWLRSEAQTTEDSTSVEAGGFPASPTEADEAVAAARRRTFGLKGVPRISFRQTYWNANILAMQKEAENSLKMLWQARGQNVDETSRTTNTMVTLAWDGAKILIQTESSMRADAAAPPNLFAQSRYWNGTDGWLGETTSQETNIYRYSTIEQLMEHVGSFYFPHWTAAGGRVLWNGPQFVLEEHAVDPQLTRYRLVGTETIDGITCDVYEGPARQERLWIEKPTGLVKAACRHYVHRTIPNYYTELVREVAGRTFADAKEFRQWASVQPAVLQAKLSAHWAAAHWPLSEPGNLSVFSDYREIAPGVRWPMHCERIVVQSTGGAGARAYQYIRGEIIVTDVADEFAIQELAGTALPKAGDRITDRRTDPVIEYPWHDSLEEREIETLRQAKRDQLRVKKEEEHRINETPIGSVADAIRVLTGGPKTDPTKVWARAIKYLVDHKDESLPELIKQLDAELRDHPMSKIAFALRAIGDRRAVPALIRALPRTLLPSRSDYGLILDDPDLCRFMQFHDLRGSRRDDSNYFNYGRAFREVVGALHRLTARDFDDLELNWVHLAESPAQRSQQRAQFHRLAQRWAQWWESSWRSMVSDAAYAEVKLPPLVAEAGSFAGRTRPPAGPGVRLQDGQQGWIVESAHESNERCFLDLDTMRQGDWPRSLPPIEQIGTNAPELVAWAQQEGFDLVGITYTPPGEREPLYCLKPLNMHTWKITPAEHRRLEQAMTGREPFPLSRPVEVMVPQREIKPPYDYEHGGDAFLFVTREGTAGAIRMTAQVTGTNVPRGAYSRDDQFRPVGFHRGAKVNFAAMTEAEIPPGDASASRLEVDEPVTVPTPRTDGNANVHDGPVLHGRVTDEQGKPIAGVQVDLYSGLATRFRGQETRTDAHGEYRFDPLETGGIMLTDEGGSYYTGVEFKHDQYVPADGKSWRDIQVPVQANHEEVLDIKMTLGGKVSGTVIDARSGKPVPELGLRIHNGFVHGMEDGDFQVYVTTDKDGAFTSVPLFPGRYVIDINDNNFQRLYSYPKIGAVTIRAGETAKLQLTTEERPDLQDPFQITGMALGEDGQSMVYGGVGVRIVGSDTKLRSKGGGIDGRNLFGLQFGPIERRKPSARAPYGVGTHDIELVGSNRRYGYKLVRRIPSEPLRITDDPDQPELEDGVRYIRPNQPIGFMLVFAKEANGDSHNRQAKE